MRKREEKQGEDLPPTYELPRKGVQEEKQQKDALLSEGGSNTGWRTKTGRIKKMRATMPTVRMKRQRRRNKKAQMERCQGELNSGFVDGANKGRRTVEEVAKKAKLDKGGSDSLPDSIGVGRFGRPAATGISDSFSVGPDEPFSSLESDSGIGRAQEKEVRECFQLGFFGELFNWLSKRVDETKDLLCKFSPTGRLFPLPSSSQFLESLFPETPSVVRSALRCTVCSLNSLNGDTDRMPRSASEYQVKVLSGLLEDCERACKWEIKEQLPSWDEFFKVKGVDYKGDEVLCAQSMRWENVSPALPKEVGSVPLEDVVEKGCRHYVLNFEDYLLDPKDQQYVKPPRVMVPPDNWEVFCRNLLKLGVFSMVHEDDLYRVQDQPVLNGLFGVSKHEFHEGWETHRIIMNLIPLNGVVRSLDGDVGTLPAWAGMNPMHLQPHEELVVSSEDVRCFFYIFRVPKNWHRFLAFNRPLPPGLGGDRPGKWYPCSAVLPMGFKNSVSLAQHVHRVVVQRALSSVPGVGGEAELRKDRPFTSSNPVHRIYLDNFDQLEKISAESAAGLKGQISPLVVGLREEYLTSNIPRHPKKGVSRQSIAEVQGAIVDGIKGIAFPKVEKIAKYAHLGRLLLEQGEATQRQMQIVGGGFVYIAMFRRPLLGALNHIWDFIVACEGNPPFIKFQLSPEVFHEVERFLGLIPLAYMDFRGCVSPHVTASDASETGGGVTVSARLTPAGVVASNCQVRGDVVEPVDVPTVLTIGLFDGIGALRVAADAVGWQVQGHVSVERSPEGRRVVESRFPGCIAVENVEMVDLAMVKDWAGKFSQVSLVLIGAGPPCQGVSGLNASKKGALRDSRSCLFTHVDRVRSLVKQAFPWAQVRSLMESVASMDIQDQNHMSASFGEEPWYIDASGVSLANRPRLYWIDWELGVTADVQFGHTPVGRRSVLIQADLEETEFLTPGWKHVGPGKFPTFTTSRPRAKAGYKPAGLTACGAHERARWEADSFRFPPYQYKDEHCVQNKHGVKRLLNATEREVIMGFPKNYTANCVVKQQQKGLSYEDARLTLIGNSWNVTVVSWLLSQLGTVLGLNPEMSVEGVVKQTSPGQSCVFQTYLQRPSMKAMHPSRAMGSEKDLVHKFLSHVSIKGEDVMLVSASDDMVKYHRLRASVPPQLWKWRTVAGWHWTGNPEHINSLEMRAALTALRWRFERHKSTRLKFVHLLDSLVCLHTLSRGRSSSRKLRRTVLRINALLLATRSQAVWAYVHTKVNPADAPSRRPQKRKWCHAKASS